MLKNILFRLSVLLCLAVPFDAEAQSNPADWWVVIGTVDGGNQSPFLARIFENEITGELIVAFCMQQATTQPGVGDRYYLHTNGLWLMPEDGSNQIMYIFKSECDYETPELEPSEDCLTFGGPITLTTSCIQGTPVWYKKESLSLTEVQRGDTYTTTISWSHYYVRCENLDASCFSEFAHVNLALDYAEPEPKPSKTEICKGEQVDLSFEPGCHSTQYLGYYDKWYLDAGYTMPVSGSLVSPASTTTYYLRCVSLSGCPANLNNQISSVTITVDQNCTAPCTAPNPTISGNTVICQGQSTSLTASGCTAGFTYLWSNNATTPSITVNTGGTYTVKCVQASRPDCESTTPGSATVTVNTPPTITAGTPVCAPNGLSYSVTFTIPAGATLATTAGTVSGNMVSEIPSGTTATITVTSAEGCTNTTTVMQNCIIPCNAPNPTVTGDLEICAGESTTLTASGCTTGYTYLWSTGATTAAITVTPTANTTYTVKCVETGRPECESINPGSASVVVNPLPTITAGSLICMNDGLTFYVNFTIPTGAILSTDYGNVYGRQVSGIPAGATATVTVTDTKGCQNTTTVTRDCTPVCETPMGVDGNRQICEGETVDLMTFTDPDNGLESEWFLGGVRLTNTVVTPTEETTYVHYYIPKEGCISGDKGQLTIRLASIPTITAGTPDCAPNGLSYAVTFTIPTGAILTATTAGTISGNTVSGIPAGSSATVTVESAEGCENTLTTVSHDCTIPCNAPTPAVAEVDKCGDGQITLTATGCTGIYSYLWSNAATTASITVNVTPSTPAYTVQCVETSRPTVCASAAVAAVVTINPIPTITAGTPSCAVDGLTYSVTFTIPAGATLTATTAGTISGATVSGIPAGSSATVTVESAEGCENTITTVSHDCTIPCNAPTPAVAEVERCGDGQITVTATGCTGIYSYLWSNAATTASITVNVTASTPAYTVRCVETSRPTVCASAAVAAVVTINPIPTITAGTPSCAVDGLTYSVTFTIPAGATLTATTAGTISGATVSGIPAGSSATVTVESAEGCENTLTTVSHDCTIPCNAPTPAVAEVERCGDGQVTLTATGCTGIYSYLWSNAATTASITVNVTASTPAYTVQCVETSRPTVCASAAVAAVVTINPIPTITAGTPVCSADNKSYSVEFTIPSGAILLTATAGTISGNSVIGIPSGTSAVVTVRSTNGCENTATVTHTCIPCITPTGAKGYRQLCQGETVDLMTFTDPANGLESEWFLDGVRLTNTVVTPTEETTIYVHYYIPKEGCISGEKGQVTIRLEPIPTITAGTPDCAPNGLSYAVTFTIPVGATLTATTAGTISGNTVSGIPAGSSATVTVESAEGCENTITTVNHNCTVPVFDLALRKVMPNGTKNTPVTPGSSVTFKIEVWNQGNVDATDISVIDYIPTGLILNDPSWTQGTGVATLTNPIAALAAGDSTSVTITFTVDADFTGSTIRNFAEISGADNVDRLEDIDSTPDSNPGNDGTPVDDKIDEDHKNNPDEDEDDHDYEDLVVTPTPVFDLALRKTMAPGSKTIYKVGDVVTFDITVFNQGTVTATSVDLVDYIPTGLTLQPSPNWTLDGDKARWIGAISNLVSGAQQTLQISFVVNASATGVITNTAEISGATNPENLEDIDSNPDDDKDNDGPPVKNDVIDEDGKNVPDEDEDDHDIESITICLDAKCITAKSVRNK